MRDAVSIIAASFVLTGCASYWHHPTKGQAAFNADHAVCKIEAERECAEACVYDDEEKWLIERCLKRMGWEGPYADR